MLQIETIPDEAVEGHSVILALYAILCSGKLTTYMRSLAAAVCRPVVYFRS
jgi:hypothetical protein